MSIERRGDFAVIKFDDDATLELPTPADSKMGFGLTDGAATFTDVELN